MSGSRQNQSSLRRRTRTITAADSPYLVTEYDYRLFVNAVGGPVIIQLPTAVSVVERKFEVKKIDPSANVVTILPAGGQTIDGAPSSVLTLQGSSVTVASDTALPGFRALDYALPGGLGLVKWGRVAIVDSVNGDDATGAVNGKPFLTVAAAVAAVAAGDLIYILPGTYALPAAGITIPANVTMKGLDRARVTLTCLGVVAATVAVTMSNESVLEDVTLRLTSGGHHTLTGVSFGGTTARDGRVRRCNIEVDNSGAGAGNSNVRGVRSFGTGTPPNGEDTIVDCEIDVHSTSAGNKRGVLVDTAANTFNVRACNINVRRTGAPGGSYIGVETSGTGTCNLRECTSAGVTADVSQTTGTLVLRATTLINNTANSLGFSVQDAPEEVIFANSGAVTSGATLFMRPGTAAPSVVETRIRGTQRIVRRLNFRGNSGPGGPRTDTWTLRKNGVDTGLAVSVSGPAVVASNGAVSVPYAEGDDLSIKQVGAVGSGTTDYVVSAEVY